MDDILETMKQQCLWLGRLPNGKWYAGGTLRSNEPHTILMFDGMVHVAPALFGAIGDSAQEAIQAVLKTGTEWA